MNDEFEQDFFDDEQFTEMMHTLSMVYREMPYGRPDPLRWSGFVDAAEKLGRIAKKNGSRLNFINVNLKISSRMRICPSGRILYSKIKLLKKILSSNQYENLDNPSYFIYNIIWTIM